MTAPLPPLSALRAFEAAARHLSFTLAAEELHVTPAAISHQIRALEEALGRALFRRLHRGLLLTDAAQAALPALTSGFRQLAAGVERLRAFDGGGRLTVSVAPAFAARWLLPRLDGFIEAHPEIEVRIAATTQLADFSRDEIDAAVRFGRGAPAGSFAGLVAERLMPESVVVVCSPELVQRHGGLSRPEQLARHTLLVDDHIGRSGLPSWPEWLAAAGVAELAPPRLLHFNRAHLVLDAAARGQGVALAPISLALDDLLMARLVVPFGPVLPTAPCYHFVCPPATAGRSAIVAFRDWLLAEGRRCARAAAEHLSGLEPPA
jgi:LysR family glycine cleavage system transcriptional activator